MQHDRIKQRNEALLALAYTTPVTELAKQFSIHRDHVYLLLRQSGVKPHKGGHCHALGKKHSPTYTSWRCMKQRVLNPNDPDNKYYIGVSVCQRWMSFKNFLADMGERPAGTTLGRFWDIGDYCPENCTWQTREEQQMWRRKKFLTEPVLNSNIRIAVQQAVQAKRKADAEKAAKQRAEIQGD